MKQALSQLRQKKREAEVNTLILTGNFLCVFLSYKKCLLINKHLNEIVLPRLNKAESHLCDRLINLIVYISSCK